MSCLLFNHSFSFIFQRLKDSLLCYAAVVLIDTGNILPASTAAPALQAQARELERHMLADNLEHKIQNRPEPEDLISQGILTEDENPREG